LQPIRPSITFSWREQPTIIVATQKPRTQVFIFFIIFDDPTSPLRVEVSRVSRDHRVLSDGWLEAFFFLFRGFSSYKPKPSRGRRHPLNESISVISSTKIMGWSFGWFNARSFNILSFLKILTAFNSASLGFFAVTYMFV